MASSAMFFHVDCFFLVQYLTIIFDVKEDIYFQLGW